MYEKLKKLERQIGNTPLIQLEHEKINLYTKLEFHNLMASVKIRPAFYIIKSALEKGEIDENTTIIESSSGNFAIALATICRQLGIRFIAVIDPNINSIYENLLQTISYRVVQVTDRDETGGFLLTRIQMVQKHLKEIPNSFWTNQYSNKDNFKAHYEGLGTEISNHFDKLDYAFIGVSSGGTISGISCRLKEKFPSVKIIAVDTEGSVIFGTPSKKRFIPGIGSSMVPPLVKEACIDEVIMVSEINTVSGCHELYNNHAIFAGGSSGTAFYAVKEYFTNKQLEYKPNVIFICADHGMPYVDTIYNSDWITWLHNQIQPTEAREDEPASNEGKEVSNAIFR
ncbi:2,3-diaminopropionate biosynthesis protein SbnA [Paenibacillus kribbensis]|uniref:2,3-diaminopropionate biosynthesis protein SbnA n=1 Tax=Paenibacillus kribbensis TaxID=172713 RepID=UPI0015BCCAB4|nr:2,3-diaminopropionate biosynthesis protein SbnA [Paenibacillus kribbensis]